MRVIINLKKQLLRNNKGVALVIIVLILTISATLALALNFHFNSIAVASQVGAYRQQALYLAEGGINRVIQRIRSGENPPNPTIEDITFFVSQPGSYSGRFSVNRAVQGTDTILTSTGIVPFATPLPDRRAERVIRVVVNANYKIISWEEVTKPR
ncbi:MAG: hypothetical protein DDT23_00939 [candidate division WS2 bacterium]|nr:hypothetical protein [Candidatus Lithacetigena glycinireducens]